jgi:hypothetical protein
MIKSMTQKEIQRLEISAQVAEFYRRGGKVAVIEYGASAYADQPVKLSRAEQVEKMRRGTRQP